MTPLQSLLVVALGVFMISTIQFFYKGFQTFWDLGEEGFSKPMKNPQYRRDRDRAINSIFENLFKTFLCAVSATTIFFLMGLAFD